MLGRTPGRLSDTEGACWAGDGPAHAPHERKSARGWRSALPACPAPPRAERALAGCGRGKEGLLALAVHLASSGQSSREATRPRNTSVPRANIQSERAILFATQRGQAKQILKAPGAFLCGTQLRQRVARPGFIPRPASVAGPSPLSRACPESNGVARAPIRLRPIRVL